MNIFKGIRDRLAQIDEVVPVLIFFEIIYLAVGQLIIWAFLPVDKPYVAIGFAIGVGFAMLSSIQNSMILGRALSRGKRKAASAGMVIFMLIRIAAISLIIVMALRFKFCSPVAVLIGVLAIQAGVYFEPMVRKRREKKAAKQSGAVSVDRGSEKSLDKVYSASSLRQAQGALPGKNLYGRPPSTGSGSDITTESAQTESVSTTESVHAGTEVSAEAESSGKPLWQETDGTYEKELQENIQKDAEGSEGV